MDLSVRYPILNFSWSCGKRWHFSRDAEFWECLSGEVEVSLDVLANDWLLVMASDVVPLDPVAVKVVEDGHTSLVISGRILNLLPVVGLGLRRTGSSSLGPVVEPSSVCWVHPSLVGGPKPSVDVFGQEVLAVTALKVAHSSGRPEVLGVWMHKTLDEIVFSLSFNGDQVHASLPAVVPGVEPVPICGLQPVIITLPRHPVKVVAKPDIALSVHSWAYKTDINHKLNHSLWDKRRNSYVTFLIYEKRKYFILMRNRDNIFHELNTHKLKLPSKS